MAHEPIYDPCPKDNSVHLEAVKHESFIKYISYVRIHAVCVVAAQAS